MTLYGALFTGVSGLDTQGQKIGIISDNIANVNTVGYKEAEAQFETLVINQSNQSAYSPGGARNETRLNIDKQGIITSTSAPSDIAISGDGFFVVNASADGSSQDLYSRAGSFRQDSLGNFVNSQGFFLQAWPLDRDGRLPGQVGNLNTISSANLESLETVNIEAASGVAQATTEVAFGINLNAGEDVYPGASATISMDPLATNNFGIDADTIIVPDEASATAPLFGLSTPNNIARGDQFTVTTGNGLSYDYQYGGFSIGRQVSSSNLATNTGDRNTDLSSTDIIGAGGSITLNNGDSFYTVDVGAAHGLSVGDQVLLSGVTLAGPSNVPISEFNGVVTVASTPAANTFTVSTTVAHANPNTTAATALYNTRIYAGNVLDATTTSQSFFQSTDLNNYTTAARSFTIANASIPNGTATFTYTASSPNTAAGQFNSMLTLAEAINDTSGLSARIVDGRLVVGASDANESITFANVDSAGSGGLLGIDWLTELDLADVAAGSRRFSTMNNLATLVNADEGVTAVVSDPLSQATLDIRVDDPLDTIRFTDFLGTATALPNDPLTVAAFPGAGGAGTIDITITQNAHTFNIGDNIVLSGLADYGVIPNQVTAAELNTTHTITNVNAGVDYTITVTTAAAAAPAGAGGGAAGMVQATNIGSLLAEFGIVTSLNGGAYVRGDSGNLGPVYDSAGSNGQNMASGDITAHFSRTLTVYDSLGAGHDLRVAYLKTGENEWAVEIFAVDETEVSSTLPNGQVASGTILFNGDASLRSVSSSLTGATTINWTNGAIASSIEFDWGTAGFPFGTTGATLIGDTDGLSQFDSAYNVAFLNQNGAPVGELISVTIDSDGFVIASFSNGENQQLYKIPLADFTNPNGLKAISGNVYSETNESGEVNLREAGTSGVGDIVSNALEASNVDLAEQLTDMIVAQRAYQSNTRVISTSDELLEQLNQI